MKISIIAAMADNGVIGRSDTNSLPWHIPEDFKHFKETTQGKPVIMGRNTWESLPKRPLPKRENVVVYNPMKDSLSVGDHYGTHSLTIAIQSICDAHLEADECFIIGGARIYQEAIALADELVITHIERHYEGDVLFPRIDPAIWEVYMQKSLTPEAAVKYYRRKSNGGEVAA